MSRLTASGRVGPFENEYDSGAFGSAPASTRRTIGLDPPLRILSAAPAESTPFAGFGTLIAPCATGAPDADAAAAALAAADPLGATLGSATAAAAEADAGAAADADTAAEATTLAAGFSDTAAPGEGLSASHASDTSNGRASAARAGLDRGIRLPLARIAHANANVRKPSGEMDLGTDDAAARSSGTPATARGARRAGGSAAGAALVVAAG